MVLNNWVSLIEAFQLFLGVRKELFVIPVREGKYAGSLAQPPQDRGTAFVLGRRHGFEIVDVIVCRIAVHMVNLLALAGIALVCPIHGFVARDRAERFHKEIPPDAAGFAVFLGL